MPTLLPTKIQQAEFARNQYTAEIEAGTPYAEILKAEFWAHVTETHLKRGTIIEAIAEDNSFWAQLLVLDTGRGWAKVHPIIHTEIQSANGGEKLASGHSITWGGPTAKFRVTSNETNTVLKDKFAAKEDAREWLDDHLRKTA